MESSYFRTRFSRERGIKGKKREFFWENEKKFLDLQSDFEKEKQAILEEITIDKKSSTRRGISLRQEPAGCIRKKSKKKSYNEEFDPGSG